MKGFPDRLQHSSGKTMTLVRDRALVSVAAPRRASANAAADAAALLQRLGVAIEAPATPMARRKRQDSLPGERINHTAERYWVRAAGRALDDAWIADAQKARLRWVAPVYEVDLDGRRELLSPLPDVLLVKAAPGADDQLAAALARRGLEEVPAKSKYLRPYRYFVVSDPWKASAYELRDALLDDDDDELIEDARLETMPMVVPTATVPNDTLFASQWDMTRIRAGGTGTTAWNLHTGNPAIIICVLDEGCDLTHPDLQASIIAGGGINLGTMMPDGSPTGNHGTACAGIAAARLGNSAGVAGVAGGCTIMPVAFDAWTDVEVAAGIRYAADHGARVISMSFGWNAWDHAIIDPAIQDAFDANVVMCVATHNYNGAITYPATNPLVMACGASDQNDNRKSPTSPDGENWGSNFGAAMSVVAPGVLCPTTDRQGNAGYVAGDYRMNFNGTSAATPHVAGLAALLLSCETTLTNQQVRDIIEQTAAKVGTVAYAVTPGYPNGTWNQQMGYGRIDCYAALSSICKSLRKDLKDAIVDKHRLVDKRLELEIPGKGRRGFKEKERIDEVKGQVGYENPEIIDPRILVSIVERLERLEDRFDGGRAFITEAERPAVGESIARTATPTPAPAPAARAKKARKR